MYFRYDGKVTLVRKYMNKDLNEVRKQAMCIPWGKECSM